MAPAPIAQMLDSRLLATGAAILLTLPYWSSGLAKLVNWEGAVEEAGHFGLRPAAAAAALTILVQIGGSVLVVTGYHSWIGAGALGVFTALATLIAHPFWTGVDPTARFHQRTTFLEHAGLIGGLVLVAILQENL